MAPSKKKSKSPTKAAAGAAAANSASASAAPAKAAPSTKSAAKQPKQAQQPVSTRPKRQVPEKRFYDELEDERPQHLSARAPKKKKGGLHTTTVQPCLLFATTVVVVVDGSSMFLYQEVASRGGISRSWSEWVIGSFHRVPKCHTRLNLHTLESSRPTLRVSPSHPLRRLSRTALSVYWRISYYLSQFSGRLFAFQRALIQIVGYRGCVLLCPPVLGRTSAFARTA